MRALLVVAALLVAGCGKSKCEKYAEIEWKCGNNPADEKDVTLRISEGFCEAADHDKAMAHFAKEADCAAKFTTCEEYKQCTAAVPW
ncbi:MAG TPA: hypothetical protein VLB44_25710 [Kofleriaceae bacterium]|nr:hypothetical protein [Kofleriaceae bacterium]